LYVYSAGTIKQRYETFDVAFANIDHTVCYSVKANFNLHILKRLAALGCGFDVVSGGELQRVLRAGGRQAAQRVVFSGVGKRDEEIDAALRAGILLFNVESESELNALAGQAARLKKKARVALRVNPDVSAETHPYISTGLHQHKFGVPIEEARDLYRRAAREKWLEVAGVSAHIGSQIMDVGPFGEAVQRLVELARELLAEGMRIRYLDAGGGLGIPYHHGTTVQDFACRAKSYAQTITSALKGLDAHLLLEPGRAIIGPAGALLTRVVYTKHNNSKQFLVVDAGMNDLIRPSLYGAHHEIVPVTQNASAGATGRLVYDVVGPICETGDFFARARELPPIEEGELLAILDAGAYGMALASNYNTRPRPAEILVERHTARVIRRRETLQDLVRMETK
jgi:diaminopimelate decarboxylase